MRLPPERPAVGSPGSCTARPLQAVSHKHTYTAAGVKAAYDFSPPANKSRFLGLSSSSSESSVLALKSPRVRTLADPAPPRLAALRPSAQLYCDRILNGTYPPLVEELGWGLEAPDDDGATTGGAGCSSSSSSSRPACPISSSFDSKNWLAAL
jgi:hypothetical protein